VITILSKGSPNIWKGAANGQVGRFLARLVEPIEQVYCFVVVGCWLLIMNV
jgi:hypothetical protein